MSEFIITSNSQGIFDEADRFLLSTIILDYNITQHIAYQNKGLEIVSFVNHAYAIELYLKCLSVIQDGGFYKGHNLLKLFNCLKDSTRQKISNLYEQTSLEFPSSILVMANQNPGTFIEIINEVKKPFIDFRYKFEEVPILPTYKLKYAVDCMRAFIMEQNPLIEEKHFPL